MDAKDFLTAFQSVDRKEVSDKAISVLGERIKVKRFSYIDVKDRNMLFKFLTAKHIFFPKSNKIEDITNDFLELSLSVDGIGGNRIVDLFKSEIQANIIKDGKTE